MSVDPSTVTELVLGPSRNTPACSPIGLHGVCGQSFTRSVVRVIRDVRELGPDYIACDPRDRSEVVLPLLGPDGRPFAVLDVDSHEVGRFTDEDARQFRAILHAAGLPG
jgi:putative methionine-R-sulfoxide reductase with GAF domain